MLIDGQFTVAAPPEVLLQHLFDVRLMASCLPGCETIEPIDDNTYRAVILMAMAGIKARFDMQVEITRRDAHNVWATTRGEEGGRASTLQADSQITLAADGPGTLVSYHSDVSITGRLGRFALGMMKKKAQNLGDEFAANLQKKLQDIAGDAPSSAGAAGPAPAATAAATSGEPVAPAGTGTPVPAVTMPAPKHSTWWQRIWAWLTGRRNDTGTQG
jgi:carbon monoxide dehydrogenase subunit G